MGFPAAGRRFGRYQVEREIGRGAMGVVFEAMDTQLSRQVALKVLNPSLSHDEEFRRRFSHEASALARVDSPYIVQIHDYGSLEDCLFITTQLIDGDNLQRMITASGPLDPVVACELAEQLCLALDDAHGAGVVHRDVKPSNVLVRYRRGKLHAYLCDFGIADAGDGSHTRTGVVVGSTAYMAPERHKGVRADERCDIYSVGCVLYWALVGRPPYEGTDIQVALAHLQSPVPTLSAERFGPLLPAIVSRALAKDPDLRYPSAHEFSEELRRGLSTLERGTDKRARAVPLREARDPEPAHDATIRRVVTSADGPTPVPPAAGSEATVRRPSSPETRSESPAAAPAPTVPKPPLGPRPPRTRRQVAAVVAGALVLSGLMATGAGIAFDKATSAECAAAEPAC